MENKYPDIKDVKPDLSNMDTNSVVKKEYLHGKNMPGENAPPHKNEQADTVMWLFSVPGRKKLYIVALTLVQTANGGSGALYALLIRNIVDAAARQDSNGFWMASLRSCCLL